MTVALDRIRFFVAKLSDPQTNRTERLACWRLISSAALDAHEKEVQEGDAINLIIETDPATKVPF